MILIMILQAYKKEDKEKAPDISGALLLCVLSLWRL